MLNNTGNINFRSNPIQNYSNTYNKMASLQKFYQQQPAEDNYNNDGVKLSSKAMNLMETVGTANTAQVNEEIGTGEEKRLPITNKPGGFPGRPNGIKEMKEMFGEPGPNADIVAADMPAGPGGKMVKVACHRKIKDRLMNVFQDIKARGLSDNIESFGGCFNPRKMRTDDKWSTHAWGIAVDLNTKDNPLNARTQTPEQAKIAEVFKDHGFFQLAYDPMHFQFCTGYSSTAHEHENGDITKQQQA